MEYIADLTPQVMLVGLTIATMQALKHYLPIPDKLYFVPVIALVIAFNFTFQFAGIEALALDEAVKTGFMASGLFGLAKPYFEK